MPSISIGLTDEQYAWLLNKKREGENVQEVIRKIIDEAIANDERI